MAECARVIFAAVEFLAGALRPADGALHCRLLLLPRRGRRHELVELHDNVGPKQPLDLDGPLRAQHMPRTVEVAGEGYALLSDLGELTEAHHLIAAAIGQDRPLPIHERVQTTQPSHPLGAGAQHQMIGVAKNDVGAGRPHFFRAHRLDGRSGAHGHERGCPDRPASHRDRACSSRPIRRGDAEREAAHALGSGRSRLESPYE